tara:strand:+ start:962 stop:1135 length:174 start_codon:yes stop_codon:yes gene_type:complete
MNGKKGKGNKKRVAKRAKKGTPSKTRKGDLDFTTKKGDKDFHRGGKDIKLKRRPFDY